MAGIRLPTPPQVYSATQLANMQAQVEQFLSRCIQNGSDVTLGKLTLNGLTVAGPTTFTSGFTSNGSATFAADVSVAGNFTFTSLTPGAFFTISGVSCRRLSFVAALSSQAQNLVFATPANAAGFPDMRALVMADLPDYVVQGVPDGTVVTVANDATANKPLGLLLNLAANSLSVGDCIRMTCRGVHGVTTVAPTLALALVAGSGGVLCTTGANVVGAVSLTNRGWEVVVDIVVMALGTALVGKLELQGRARLSTSATAAQDIDMENTAQLNFNTTIAQTLQLCVTWGTANAANTISCRQTIWEILKA